MYQHTAACDKSLIDSSLPLRLATQLAGRPALVAHPKVLKNRLYVSLRRNVRSSPVRPPAAAAFGGSRRPSGVGSGRSGAATPPDDEDNEAEDAPLYGGSGSGGGNGGLDSIFARMESVSTACCCSFRFLAKNVSQAEGEGDDAPLYGRGGGSDNIY